jgi:Fur family ferric uptake transcriptional regulator
VKPKIEQKAKELLGSANLRRTGPRMTILAVLLGSRKPQTADQIAAKLGRPAPNRVTIYRTLEAFVEADLVHKAFLDERTWHFELADRCSSVQCHPHFICTKCGLTQCLVGLSVPVLEGLRKGFVTHRQQVRLEGLCPGCA